MVCTLCGYASAFYGNIHIYPCVCVSGTLLENLVKCVTRLAQRAIMVLVRCMCALRHGGDGGVLVACDGIARVRRTGLPRRVCVCVCGCMEIRRVRVHVLCARNWLPNV